MGLRAVHRGPECIGQKDTVNPAADLELPPVAAAPMVTLTHEQARALLAAAQGWQYTLALLGLATGARLGELLALRWTDVDLQVGTVRIGRSLRVVGRRLQVKGPKTEAGYRTVALGPTVAATLRRLRAEPNGGLPKVIFCSVENEIEQIREALDAGADEYIMKPFDGGIVAGKLSYLGIAA